ncbi:hypothetical protein KL938_004259 [Ogataea parapolymorpha]|nr:hypothetical protein KL938_004259 [Ogataea parapolymorpha]
MPMAFGSTAAPAIPLRARKTIRGTMLRYDDEGAEREGVAGNDPGGLRRRRVELLLQALGHGERGGDVEVVETRADEDEDVGEVFGSVQRDH